MKNVFPTASARLPVRTTANRRPVLLSLLPALLIAGVTAAAAPRGSFEPLHLRAGPLTMVFEPENAFLRYVRLGEHELWRGLNAPVRDQFWGTVRPEVTELEVDQKSDRFTVKFRVHCRERDIDFAWRGQLKGSPDGRVEFGFDGTARSTFLRNRIGFCLLHGPSAAGRPWVIEHVGGQKKPGRFPEFISPHQPAKEIRAIAHEFAPGQWAHVRLEGEVFEMEDQRNWTDASFKTYCIPLEKPFPVEIARGTRIVQKVTLTLDRKNSAPVAAGSSSSTPILTLREEQTSLPRIGLRISSEYHDLSPGDLNRLKALKLDHLRVDVAPSREDFARQLRQAIKESQALGVRLHVALHLGKAPEEDLKRLETELKTLRPAVAVWLIIGAEAAELANRVREFLKPYEGDALIGVGQDTNFTELNRARPKIEDVEVVSYGINPQVHAFDNASIVETLPIQGDTVRSARQFLGDRPLIISPVTLRPQAVKQAPLPGQLPSDVDARQTSLFAAGWTLGSVKFLAEAGVEMVTYYETAGWKGVMESGGGTPRSGNFPSRPGEVFPVYHIFHELADFSGGQVQRVDSTDELAVLALALRKSTGTNSSMRLLVANLTEREQPVSIRGFGRKLLVRKLDSRNADSAYGTPDALRESKSEPIAMELPLRLAPYSIARIDSP